MKKNGIVAAKLVSTKNGEEIEPMSVALTMADLGKILDSVDEVRQLIREVEEENEIPPSDAPNRRTEYPQYRWVLMDKTGSKVSERSVHWFFYQGHALDAGEEVR